MDAAMSDVASVATLTLAGLTAFLIATAALLRGWRDWLDLKQAELVARDAPVASVSPATRIELADLKARVRRLEAIANGVES